MLSIKETIMKRDDLTSDEADYAIAIAKEEIEELLAEGDLVGAESICEDHFGLEPDYLMELL